MEAVYLWVGFWLCWICIWLLTAALFGGILIYTIKRVNGLHRLAWRSVAYSCYKTWKKTKNRFFFQQFKDFTRNGKKEKPDERL